MYKKIKIVILGILIVCFSFSQISIAIVPGEIREGNISLQYRNVTVYAPAVAQTTNGYIGIISTITLTIQNNGSGRVFVDTLPLTQIDMQGSARLAVKVADALVRNDERSNITPSEYDYFFVVRTASPIIAPKVLGSVKYRSFSYSDKRSIIQSSLNPAMFGLKVLLACI